MRKVTILTEVQDFGHTVVGFDITWDDTPVSASDFSLSGCESAVTDAVLGDGILHLSVTPFPYLTDFTLTGKELSVNKETAFDCKTAIADSFTKHEEDGVLYRLYTPKANGPRPLILFLHGGGEVGFDNEVQMTATIGAAALAERYPDAYVMAPQAPGLLDMSMIHAQIGKPFAESDLKIEFAWHRKYLAGVCDIIRAMIAEGKVNANRVYVTGLSMGGAGTLRALSIGSDLFAAAVPICPSMMPETFAILKSLTHMKIWVAAAYLDHSIYRHKYIIDGILALKDAGNKHAHLTLFSPEELAKYGIATNPDLTLEQRAAENHFVWIPVYHNEYGILDWMMSQTKE